jgi:hypothetical protein
MRGAGWPGYAQEGHRFWEIAQAAGGLGHTSQAVSNAIHAAINYNDAVCLCLKGHRSSGDSHTQAAELLREACRGTRWAPEAKQQAERFLGLIRHKSEAEYHGAALSGPQTASLLKQAARFIEWAEGVLDTPK